MGKMMALLFILLINGSLWAQSKPPVELPLVRECDVMWAKEIWRVIDIKDSYNLPYFLPLGNTEQKNLFEVITEAIREEKLNAFETDELKDTISVKSVFFKISVRDTIIIYEADEFGNEIKRKELYADTLKGEYIIQYWIKEVWFFDKQRSVMDVRISAICPVKIDEEKEILIPLFWIDFNEARKCLNEECSINKSNFAESRTFDELFLKRRFETTIKKEGNIYDREIAEYVETDKQAMQESDRIKEYLRNFEYDRWQY